MSKTARLAAVALPLGLLLSTLPARASLLFPEAIKNELGLEAVPPPAPGCRICHRDDKGGKNNVTRLFGRTMMDNGAVAASVPAMLGALHVVEEAELDSDGDGTGDVQELRDGTDPNVAPPSPDGQPAPPVEDIPLPQTGCAVAAARATGGLSAMLPAALWLLVWRRRRRCRRA